MKTSFIYIILLIFGILLIVPGILLKSRVTGSENSFGVEYNLGWDKKLMIPATETPNENYKKLDFYEEEYELEDWMMEPESWKTEKIQTGNQGPDSSASGLIRHSSGVFIQIIAEL